MRFGLDEIQLDILRLLNDRWYENHLIGLSFYDLVTKLGADETKVAHAIEILVNNNLVGRSLASIQREASRYVINANGIDLFEKTLPSSKLRQNRQKRREILEKLKVEYDKDPHQYSASHRTRITKANPA